MDEFDYDTEQLISWIVTNVKACDVPEDEGNETALLYNLVSLAVYGRGYAPYAYLPEQDAFINRLIAEFKI